MRGSQKSSETPSASTSPSSRPWRRRPPGRLLPLAILLACLSVGALLAGCGGGTGADTTSGSSSVSSDDSATPAASTTPDGGEPSGTLGWSTIAPESWDPVTSVPANDISDLSLVYASLTRIGPKGEAEPALASHWEFSKDGRTFTIFLRKGLKFTDGTPLDAQAVKVNLLRGEHQSASLLAPFLGVIQSVTVVNPTELSLSLSTPDYALPLVLGGKSGMIVSPKAIKDDAKGLATQPVGAGPFELTNYTPPTSATLVRNPNYWDAKDIHLEGVDLKFFDSEQPLLSSLLSGQSQLATINGEQVKSAESAGFEVQEFPSWHVFSIEVNDKTAPFENHKVVEAINYAIDREALMQTLVAGHGELDDEIFPPSYGAYNKSVANYYTYDPEKAKELLKEAGYDGTPITITWIPNPWANYQTEGELLQAQLQAVGIDVTLQTIPYSQAFEALFVKHSASFAPFGSSGREAPSQLLEYQYGEHGYGNPGGDASPELSKALEEIPTHPIGSPAYESSLQEATKLATEQGAAIMLFTQPFLLAHTSAVTGLTPWIQTPRLEGVRLSE
jgi:ABC-type transport system substrate-binding protein